MGLTGYIVTWDTDSRNGGQCARLRRFVFGQTLRRDGKVYRYRGFVEVAGVRYLGQSILFVTVAELPRLRRALQELAVDHVITAASLGERFPG